MLTELINFSILQQTIQQAVSFLDSANGNIHGTEASSRTNVSEVAINTNASVLEQTLNIIGYKQSN